MTLDDGAWLMVRADPDFHQRKDFDLIFERQSSGLTSDATSNNITHHAEDHAGS